LYPEVPGVAGLAVGSPLFPSTKIVLGHQQVIAIDASGAPARYVQALTVGGKTWSSPWLPWDALKNGAQLAFTLGASPSMWGSDAAQAPPSFGPGVHAKVADAFDNDGVGNNGLGLADFDGGGWSYSTQAMSQAMSGSTFVFGGITFPWSNGNGLDNFI